MQKLIFKKLSEIIGEIKAINARIDSLEKTMNTRIDSLEKTFNERFISLRNEMISLRSEMFTKFDSLEKNFNNGKIKRLEIRIARLEKNKYKNELK
jgi:hypothetical protein